MNGKGKAAILPPTPADYIQGILSRKAQAGKPGYSQSLYNLKDAANMLNFLQVGNIMDMAGLDEKFKSMIGEQLVILFTAAKDYLKGVMNGYSILRQEQREQQPHRKRDMER